MKKIIDLTKYYTEGVMIFLGEDRAKAIRDEYDLDNTEDNYDEILVKIPNDISAISVTFFRGLLGNSLYKLGAEQFRKKYKFDCCEEILNDDIEDAIRILTNSKDHKFYQVTI